MDKKIDRIIINVMRNGHIKDAELLRQVFEQLEQQNAILLEGLEKIQVLECISNHKSYAQGLNECQNIAFTAIKEAKKINQDDR